MRTYEALYIVRPDVKDDEIQTVAKAVEKLLTDQGGSTVRSEIWGKRKLAYEVKHYTEGHYVLLRFESQPDFVARLENYFRLSEEVIRYLVTYFDEKTLRLEAEQQKRKESEIQASAGQRSRRHDRDDDDDDDDEPRGRRPSRSSGSRYSSDSDDEDDD